ncbi:type VI secretion system protein TssA [Niveispirillum sp. SYP-B3756]|uniref:type VI secretion system protein TssA n=1 Tax=Niveispirillum sp. SYP-B3756 TaxID=2662178 RepID=UPI001563565D|nr:type VI secretion system protein TssA [Niveispirillum sp. SYP-B3756]
MALFDLDILLTPLEGPRACGPDLRGKAGGEGGYYHLKDLRAGARATERRADSDDEAQAPLKEWQQILESGTALLTDRSKDLEVAVWLVEAAVRLDGFAGLADGFRLLTGLVERFWDNVHPLPDEDGVGVRMAAVAGLNGIGAEGTLIQPIRKVPLLRNDGGFAFWHFQLAQRAVQTPDTRNRPNRTPSPDALRQRMAAVPVAEKRRLLAYIRACRAAFADLDRVLTERCGTEAPPTSAIANLLEEIEDATLFLTELNKEEAMADPVAADDPILETSVSGTPIQITPPRSGPAVGPEGIASREEALRLLADIGRFFRRTEPHSPISYTIEDLVRRGQMTLPELLAELVADPAVRNSMLTAAGIRVPPPS